VKTVTDTDDIVEQILTTYDTIAVVGASAAPAKAAHSVPLHMQQHGWRIIPVNPHAATIFDEPVYRRLADIPEQIGLVDVFRPSAEAAEVTRQAVAGGSSGAWPWTRRPGPEPRRRRRRRRRRSSHGDRRSTWSIRPPTTPETAPLVSTTK
jgi:predicted CoA-binding protein